MNAPPPTRFARYRPVAAQVRRLALRPELESWNRADDPAQARLADFVDHLESLVAADLIGLDEVAVLLQVRLAAERERFGGGDLDNYAFPVARHLGAARLASFRISKGPGGPSSVSAGPALVEDAPSGGEWSFAAARATASATTSAWKRQVNEQIGRQAIGWEVEVGVWWRSM